MGECDRLNQQLQDYNFILNHTSLVARQFHSVTIQGDQTCSGDELLSALYVHNATITGNN